MAAIETRDILDGVKIVKVYMVAPIMESESVMSTKVTKKLQIRI